MVGVRKIPAENKTRVCQHPDANSGEIWVTNKPTKGASLYAEEHSLRVGTTAYNKMAIVVPGFQPVFGPAKMDAHHCCQGYCNHKNSAVLKV